MGFLAKSLSLKGARWAVIRGIAWKTGFDFHLVGEMIQLQIDPEQGLLKASLELKGEEKPLVLDEVRFSIQGQKLSILSLKSDREWLNGLASMTLPISFEPGDAVIKALALLR